MRIDIQYINAGPDWDTKKYIAEKLNKLQSHYAWIMDMNVYMKNENNDHNKNQVVELKLTVPGETLFAEARSENFLLAAIEAMQGLERQIRKYSTRKTSHHLERKSFHKVSPAM